LLPLVVVAVGLRFWRGKAVEQIVEAAVLLNDDDDVLDLTAGSVCWIPSQALGSRRNRRKPGRRYKRARRNAAAAAGKSVIGECGRNGTLVASGSRWSGGWRMKKSIPCSDGTVSNFLRRLVEVEGHRRARSRVYRLADKLPKPKVSSANFKMLPCS